MHEVNLQLSDLMYISCSNPCGTLRVLTLNQKQLEIHYAVAIQRNGGMVNYLSEEQRIRHIFFTIDLENVK